MQRIVRRPTKLAGMVTPPGDKSISHRSLMLNSIAAGESRVSGLGRGEDVVSTMRCMQKLGATIDEDGSPDSVRIRGLGSALHEPEDILDAGNSGTSMRLLGGLVAGQSFLSVITGDASLRSRPMGRIVQPLQAMGARISGRNGDTLAPLAISGGGLKGIEYTMPVASAQVKSALLLAGLSASGPTVLHQPALSRDHTERMLRAMGATVDEDGLALTLHPATLSPVDVVIPSDISSAAFWLVAACCHPDADVTVAGVGINASRTGILEALEAMGADIALENQREEGGEPVADLHVRSCQLRGTEIGGDMIPRLIDEIPVMAVAACYAEGATVIRDAQELRVKESDRLASTANLLASLGAQVEETHDGLIIQGSGRLNGTTVTSHGDHRLAMAMAVAGLVADGQMTVEQAESASVSYPSFWDHLDSLTGDASN
jgi:3-phosphoshikimate 1-carboxyvinyltransferase